MGLFRSRLKLEVIAANLLSCRFRKRESESFQQAQNQAPLRVRAKPLKEGWMKWA